MSRAPFRINLHSNKVRTTSINTKLTASLLAVGMALASVSAFAAHHEKKDGMKEGDKKEMMDKDHMKKDGMKKEETKDGMKKDGMKKEEMKK